MGKLKQVLTTKMAALVYTKLSVYLEISYICINIISEKKLYCNTFTIKKTPTLQYSVYQLFSFPQPFLCMHFLSLYIFILSVSFFLSFNGHHSWIPLLGTSLTTKREWTVACFLHFNFFLLSIPTF